MSGAEGRLSLGAGRRLGRSTSGPSDCSVIGAPLDHVVHRARAARRDRALPGEVRGICLPWFGPLSPHQSSNQLAEVWEVRR